MNAQNALRAIDIHSHWSTRRGYPLQTEAEVAQQEHTWRSKPEYRSEAEMAEDFRRAGVRVILDFGYTKYLTLDQAREVHDYGFAVREAYSDVIIGNLIHFQPELGAPALAEFRRCLDRAAGLSASPFPVRAGCRRAILLGSRSIGFVSTPKYRRSFSSALPGSARGCPAAPASFSIPVILAIWMQSPPAFPI